MCQDDNPNALILANKTIQLYFPTFLNSQPDIWFIQVKAKFIIRISRIKKRKYTTLIRVSTLNCLMFDGVVKSTPIYKKFLTTKNDFCIHFDWSVLKWIVDILKGVAWLSKNILSFFKYDIVSSLKLHQKYTFMGINIKKYVAEIWSESKSKI